MLKTFFMSGASIFAMKPDGIKVILALY